MRIELRPGFRSPVPGAMCVGIIDGKPLSYLDRTPHIGAEPTTHAAIAEALADGVDEAATRVFGSEWNGDLSRITGINRRTVTHDRIMKFGLPPWVLDLVGRASAHPHPRTLGFILLSLAALRDDVDRETSLVVCNESAPEQGKGYHALQLGVPVVSDAQFIDSVGTVVGGRNMEEFADITMADEQFALF